MAEKCLRNASCKCSMCAGFDVASLMSISKSISSTIKYGDEDEDTTKQEAITSGGVTNSPCVPFKIKSNSPLLQASERLPPVQEVQEVVEIISINTSLEDSSVADAGADNAVMLSSLTVQDTISETVVAMPSSVEVGSPNNAQAQDTEVTMGTVLPKMTDKNWKVRKEGYEELKTLLERPDVQSSQVREAMELFTNMCEDANASAMEAGMAAVLAYTRHIEPFEKQIVGPVMARVIDKGFSARPGIVKLCMELTDAFIAANAAEATVSALLEGTTNRKPKVPPACATCIFDALTAYGPHVVPLQAIKAALPKLLEGAVKVRPIAMSLLVEIYRWTGPAIVQDIVANLRQAQKVEFEDQTKEMICGQAVPTKFIRGARAANIVSSSKAKSSVASAAESGAQAFDPRDFVESVDLLSKLAKSDFKTKLALPKWSEKVEALKIVLDLIGPVPKLVNGDYYELVSTLKTLTSDSNVNIVAKAIEVFGALADGLRKSFTQFARMIFPELLRKFSDKKSVILNATNKTLDLFLQHAMTIEMMMDDLKLACDASKNKAPPARVQVMAFVARAVENRYVDLKDKALILSFGGMFMKGIEDTDPKVREAGQNDFVFLLQASDQAANWLLNMTNEIASKNPRAHKAIQRGLGGNAVSTPSRPVSSQLSKSDGAPSRSPSHLSSAESAASRSSFKALETDVDMDVDSSSTIAECRGPSLKKRGPPTRFGLKLGNNAVPKANLLKKALVSGSNTGSPKTTSTEFTSTAISVTAEEADVIVADLRLENWSSIQEGFASTKWMERKEAIEGLEEFARTNANMMSVQVIEAITVYLSKQVKGFKDSNINVLKSAFQAVGTFAEIASCKFPRGVVCVVTPRACDKIGDKKANEAVRAMILQFCEATSPSYTTGCMINYMPKVRLPLAQIEALLVLSDCVKDFGISTCNPRILIDYAKGPQGLEASNSKVRSAAIALLSTMYSQLGPALLPILNLESWKPALAKTVEEEFKKVGFDPAIAMKTVKRQVKGHEELTSATDPGALFGRVDVSSHITKELLDDMKNETDKVAWKKRAEAIDRVQAICEGAGCAIELTRPVQDVLRSLKARLNDSNANLKVKATNVIAVVATSVGPEIAKMSKFLGASLIAGVADNKKTMQLAAVQALNKWVFHNHTTNSNCMESLLPSLSDGLMNPVGRAELLGWAVEHLQRCEKVDLSCMVVPTIQCMMDKSSEAREKAQLFLIEVMKSVGKDVVLTTGCRDIKPAAMRALKPLLQKVCDVVETFEGPARSSEASKLFSEPNVMSPAATSAISGAIGGSGLRRKASPSAFGNTPSKSRLARPSSARTSSNLAPPVQSSAKPAPSLKISNNKPARIAKGHLNKWIFESTSLSDMKMRKSEIEVEWKPFLSPEFHAKLFAPSLEKGMLSAMDELTLCIAHHPDEIISLLDLVLKWCTLRVVDNNVQALAKLLEVLVKLLEMLKDTTYQLDDVEAAILLPYLLQECGQSKPRFRVRFRDVMKLIVDVYNPEQYVVYLMECFNGSKNMKSRCECIDMVEYIVSVHGYHVIGRKCIKEVGKYVVAHEKELRESAISALVAVYSRTENRNADKFFRFAGITTQQGVDLLTARLKHLPAHNVSIEPSASLKNDATEREVSQQPRTGFGFGFGRASVMAPPAPTNVSGPSFTNAVKVGQPSQEHAFDSGVQHDKEDPFDDDVDMSQPRNEVRDEDAPSAVIEELLLRPIEKLMNSSKEIVQAGTPAYKEGGNALKGLYAIINRPTDPSEVDFLHSYVNEIVLALCDCIHGAFYAGNAEKRPEMYILAISITTLTVVFSSDAVTSLQRYVVERVLLELCSKIMDPRMEKFSEKATLPASEIATLPPEDKRYLMLFKALYKAMRKLTERARLGDVYPSVINLLQRLMHNDVGDYNKNDTLKHLLKEDSLDQLIGRILIKLSKLQANSLTPFEGIDIFGVLMQMHMFFSTLPSADVMMVDIANDNMRSALKIMTESLSKTRPSVFEASMKDIPPTSPVRQALEEMSIDGLHNQDAAEPTGLRVMENDNISNVATAAPRITSHFGSRSALNSAVATSGENLARRLFPSQDSAHVTRTARTTSVASSAAETTLDGNTRGRSFTSFHAFTATRGSASNLTRPSTTSAQLESLRERLQMSRHFN